MTKKIATFTINGRSLEAIIEPHLLLIDVIRENFGLTGAKRGCGSGDCGACTVLLEGQPVSACLTLAVSAAERPITTVEGLAHADGTLHPLQQAFIDHGAAQCGYCTPGVLISAAALLAANNRPTAMEIKRALSGNICRCTGYVKIIDAVLDAASRLRRKSEQGVAA